MSQIYKVLIITGIVTDEHDPKVNAMLRFMLESTGRFKVKLTEEFRGATAETLKSYDAVLVNYDGKENVKTDYVGWGSGAERVLYDFVASGKGAIIYHSSMILGNPTYPEEFVKLVGGEFNFDNGGRKSPKLELRVDMNTDTHPITEKLAKSWHTSQEDFFSNIRLIPNSSIRILATVEDNEEDYDLNKMQRHLVPIYKDVVISKLPNINKAHPVAWTNTYGKGRVFVVSIGHGPDTIKRMPFVVMMCRGTEWAASGEVTIDVPNIEYENRLNVWPFYTKMTVTESARIVQALS